MTQEHDLHHPIRQVVLSQILTLKPDAGEVSEETLMAWCRERMAHFKTPRTVVFGELPKTSTGKIQKFALRDRANSL